MRKESVLYVEFNVPSNRANTSEQIHIRLTACIHLHHVYMLSLHSQAVLSSLSLCRSVVHFKENKTLLLLRLQTAFN